MTTGWKLTRESREALLERHPPRYGRVVANHVTCKPGSPDGPPEAPRTAAIVGHADDGRGVEAFVVAIDGGTGRPDGGTWHITWSLGEGREARESNDVILQGWQLCAAEPVDLKPASW